jgi:hypothetical protein
MWSVAFASLCTEHTLHKILMWEKRKEKNHHHHHHHHDIKKKFQSCVCVPMTPSPPTTNSGVTKLEFILRTFWAHSVYEMASFPSHGFERGVGFLDPLGDVELGLGTSRGTMFDEHTGYYGRAHYHQMERHLTVPGSTYYSWNKPLLWHAE